MRTDEYRYLTFLFCDLVGSTRLSQMLDHEDWRFVLGQFRKNCLDRVREHGGVVHECQGDGFLFYFGYPVAHEDSPLRAVNAAMAIIHDCQNRLPESAAVLASNNLPGLSVRAGIHSGKVVIGMIDGEFTATGFPLAYTVRLHSLAEPNRIVVSDATRHLISRRIRLIDKGCATLKGIDYPVAYHEVVSQQLQQHDHPKEVEFVCRRREKADLQYEWMQAAAGNGRAVLVQGEAGIGKSRLLQELLEYAIAAGSQALQWHCLSHTQSIALNPVIKGFSSLVAAYSECNAHASASLAANASEADYWLNVFTKPEHSSLPTRNKSQSADTLSTTNAMNFGAEKRKRIVLEGLADWLVQQSRQRPLLLVLEDMHWVDPSTLEFLMVLGNRLNDSSVLLIMSQRCDTADAWQCPFSVREINLDRFSDEEATALIRSMPGSQQLSGLDIDRLVQRSDGVPLFIEESTAMLIDHDDIDRDTRESISPGNHSTILNSEYGVPYRLMDLLAARLDRTGDARYTAGLAASIGRSFNKDLLLAVSDIDSETLDSHLDTLLRKGLLQWENEKQRWLIFKHELVRDSAYASLLKSTRRIHHSKIAQALESGEHSKGSVEPEILAYHFSEAQMREHALDCWLLAAKNARLNSNPMEAISHYAKVKELLAQLPEDSKLIGARVELEMLTGLGACHIALHGYGSDDSRASFEAAELIAKRMGNVDKVMKIRFGLEAYYFMRGDFNKAQEISRSCYELSEAELRRTKRDYTTDHFAKAQLSLAQSSWALGNVYFHQGEFSLSMPLLEQCIALCEHPENTAIQLAHNPDIMSRLYSAWYECESGSLDDALDNVVRIVEKSRHLDHAYTQCVALAFNACIHLFRREYAAAVIRADESIQLSEGPGFLTWLAWAKVLRGRALCEEKATRTQGLAEIDQSIELWDNSGAIVTRPFALALQAESFTLDGDNANAWRSIELARETMNRSGERYYESEIFRIRGVLCRVNGETELAERCFRRSIEFADKRAMARAVMRSSIELARLHQQMGVPSTVLKTLQNARESIVGGLGTQDLKTADELITSMELG